MLVALFFFSSSALAQKKGKGGGKGDDGPTDPPAAPVSYSLDTVFVEGYSPSTFDINDDGDLLYAVTLSEITSTNVPSEATQSAAIVNLNTGQVQYIDQLLTQTTPWTVRAADVESVSFLPQMINSRGDCIGIVSELLVNGDERIESFLLSKQVDGLGNITYAVTSLGAGKGAIMLNDLGQIVCVELADPHREFVRFADGSKLYFDELGLGSYLSGYAGLNNVGELLAADQQDFIFDLNSLGITPVDGFEGFSSRQRISINDSGAIAGVASVSYEEKRRGKIRTFSYHVPALLDPDSGFQLFDNGIHFDTAMLNHQRLNGESALLASNQNGTDRAIWLKLPDHEGFFVYDALEPADQAVWRGFLARGNCEMLTPRKADGSVDHEAAPMVSGVIRLVDDTGLDYFPGGFWVLRPAS